MKLQMKTVHDAESRRSGFDILADALVKSGIGLFFIEEHPHTASLCAVLSDRRDVKFIQPVSEISCVPMADVCARYTGKPVAAITAGAGHCLNQIMGITTAWGDKSPVVSIGIMDDSVPDDCSVFDRASANLTKSFGPVTVYCARIDTVGKIVGVIGRAVRESRVGKGGPVHLEIDRSLLDARYRADDVPSVERFVQPESPRIRAEDGLLAEAFGLLRRAKRPIIFAGGGVIRSGASAQLHKFAQMTGIPLLASLGAMDLLDPEGPCYVGPPSYLSGEAFHYAVKNADVCLALGTSFSELDGFGLPPIWSDKIRFIQVNIDHHYISLNPQSDIAIVADAGEVLHQMIELSEKQKPIGDFSKWLGLLKKKNRSHGERVKREAQLYNSGKTCKLHPFTAFSIIRDDLIDENTIGVMDGGNTALWGGMLICAKGPGRFHFPTGMATLGVGIPMAIALKAAAPEKKVILVSGDGSFLFNVQELELIARYNLPIVMVVNNDSSWNMMRLGEVLINKAISAPLPPLEYTRIAASFGIQSVKIADIKDWEACRKDVTGSSGPLLIELITDRDIQPDSIVSFIRVELMGSLIPPFKKLRRIYQSELSPGRNTINLIKFLFKTI